MPKVTYVCADGREIEANVEVGVDLMHAALYNSVPAIVGECGAGLACATCRVHVPPEWQSVIPPAQEQERELLGFCEELPPATRLACQIKMSEALDGIRLLVPDDQF